MWSHLIKLVSLGKGALVVGVAASAAMVSSAEISNAPARNEVPSASPSAIVSTAPTAKPAEPAVTPTEKPKAAEQPKSIEQPKSAEQPKSNDPAKPDLTGVIKECVTKYLALRAAGDGASQGDRESTTAVCKNAIERTGLTTAEFAAKYGLLTAPAAAPKTEKKDTGLDAAIKQCLADWRNYAETASAACAQALAASGLSPEEFWKKFEAWAVQQQGQAGDATEPKPSTTPKPSANEQTSLLLATCFKLHNAITSTTEKSRIDAAYDACNKAIAATGMSVTEFWTKYAKELAPAKPSPTATPKPVTNTAEVAQLIAKCLDLYKNLTTTGDTRSVSDACRLAIQASGMTSADFWAKFHPATN